MTPIQSRFAASLCTLLLLGVVYWALSHTQFAYASDVGEHERRGADHNWHRIQDEANVAHTEDDLGIGTSMVVRRDALTIEANDSPNRGNLSPGSKNVWRYPQSLLLGAFANQGSPLPSNLTTSKQIVDNIHVDLRKREGEEAEELVKRQSSRQVYISINTCLQPSWTNSATPVYGPPQLTLYVGQSSGQDVGPGGTSSQAIVPLVEGYANYTMSSSSDIYLAVGAPSLSSNFSGTWTYDLAISIDGYYHGLNSQVPFLYLVDTDTTSTLLVTDDLTLLPSNNSVYQQWMSLTSPLPFTVFAIRNDDSRDMGISQSFCGMQNIATIPLVSPNSTANTTTPYFNASMVTRGLKNGPKQQFLFMNLNRSTEYDATLALVGNGVKSGKGVVGGGGIIWQETGWTTKTDGNCQLLYDLDFCDKVAYAVPSNLTANMSTLKQEYDSYAQALYQNFSYSLAQVQCNTSNDQRYSLARNCDDCQKAYKDWLCAVTLPRCEDFSNTASYLQPRNVGQVFLNQSALPNDLLMTPYQPMPGAPTLPGSPIDQTWISAFATNQSRNPAIIDVEIKPGPYKEVLPCEDICYNLVQSCPAALGFSCPAPGRGLEAGYAPRPDSQSVVQCNYFGAVWYIDDARHLTPSVALIIIVAVMAASASYL